MYCKDCGHKVEPVLFVPSKCPGCKRPLDYAPTWVPTVTLLVLLAVSLAVILVFRALSLPLAAGAALGVALGILAFNLLQVVLFRTAVMTCDSLTAQRPAACRRQGSARKLSAAQQIEVNLAQVDLPKTSLQEGRRLAVERPAPRAQRRQAPAPVRPRHRNTYDEVRANDAAGIAELGALSSSIVKEHFDPIIGPEQNDYMIRRFNTPEAIGRQLGEEGYRYFFVNDPEASASALPADRHVGFVAFYPRKAGELYLSKFYLRRDCRGRGLSRDMLAFVADAARELDCNRITLNVNRNNYQAILAYEHLGFKKVREEKNDIGNGFFMDDFVYELAV